ncbi:MAG TPA: beta-ketoacyl-ACP synthase III [Aggregatilineales bacterium]|nr:beta-ketoacyl-ACP synthase III [Aggregatilineales bacterium]
MVNKNGRNGSDGSSLSGNGSSRASANGHSTKAPFSNGKYSGLSRSPLRNGRGKGGHGPSRYAHIVGWGMKVPDGVMTNFDLEAVVDTTDEWIRKGTGIVERRIASDRESVVTLGFEAARAALDKADVLPTELDMIIVATSTPEDIYPSSASRIQNMLGANRAGAFDLSAACSGFVYGLNMATQCIRSGSMDKILVIGAEVNSRVLDWSDRTTCILFGDGAGAVLLQGSDQPGGLLSCVLGSDGSGSDLLGIPTVGYAILPEGQLMHKIHMNGREVFRFATHIMHESIKESVQEAGLSMKDIALIVPHQANQRILNAAARSLNVPEELFYSNVDRYGNTSAASIPIALCEAVQDKRIKPNDHIVLVGFGGGLTWAAATIQWQVVPVKAVRGIGSSLGRSRREAQYVLAYWRARIIRIYRRLEAFLGGSPTRKGHIRSVTLEPETKPHAKTQEADRTRPTRPAKSEKTPRVPEVEHKRE